MRQSAKVKPTLRITYIVGGGTPPFDNEEGQLAKILRWQIAYSHL
jgi:hypothetical protein